MVYSGDALEPRTIFDSNGFEAEDDDDEKDDDDGGEYNEVSNDSVSSGTCDAFAITV